MTIDAQTIAPCRQKLAINVLPDETSGPYEEIVNAFTQRGTLPGFRAGKAPRPMIERHYRAEIDNEVRRSLVTKFYRKALEQEKITALEIVDIEDVHYSPSTGLGFVVTIDVAPEFELPQYKNIPVKIPETPAITDEDVENQIVRMRRMYANQRDVNDEPAQLDDTATLDYEARRDGQPLAEILPNLEILTGIKKHPHTLGANMGLPKAFDDALVGAKTGDTRSFDITFPSDFQITELQGVKVTYTATLTALKRPVPLDDAEFLAKLQFTKGMDDLRGEIRADFERRNAARQREMTFEAIAQQLDSRCKFDLPKNETAQEVNRTTRSMLNRIIQSGASREQIEEHRDTLLKDASDTAERRLRMRYILSRIADEEKVVASNKELNQRLQEIALENNQPLDKIKASIEKNYGLEAVRQEVRIRKVVDLLVASAETK